MRKMFRGEMKTKKKRGKSNTKREKVRQEQLISKRLLCLPAFLDVNVCAHATAHGVWRWERKWQREMRARVLRCRH